MTRLTVRQLHMGCGEALHGVITEVRPATRREESGRRRDVRRSGSRDDEKRCIGR
jgi:hypothetical protein